MLKWGDINWSKCSNGRICLLQTTTLPNCYQQNFCMPDIQLRKLSCNFFQNHQYTYIEPCLLKYNAQTLAQRQYLHRSDHLPICCSMQVNLCWISTTSVEYTILHLSFNHVNREDQCETTHSKLVNVPVIPNYEKSNSFSTLMNQEWIPSMPLEIIWIACIPSKLFTFLHCHYLKFVFPWLPFPPNSVKYMSLTWWPHYL